MSMKLSAEMFDEIVSTLRSDGTRPKEKEKRSEGRVGLRCALDIVLYPSKAPGENKPLRVCVHDISVGGIGLVCSSRLAPGTEFIACFSRDDCSPVPVLYKVKHCRRMSSDLFTIGAMFTRVLPDRTGEVLSLRHQEKAVKAKAGEEHQPAPATATTGAA
jgi:hypothetical protein